MSIADLKVRISGNADQFDSAMKKMQKSFNRTVRKMERAGRNMTRNITVPIGLMAAAAGKAAIDFESAFAGVRKTVDATETEFAGLRKGILDMSKVMPTSANEIAGVAEAAGQLGIQTDKILEFSRTMVMLGDTTNMAAQEAATSLARVANIMQVPQDRFDEMGSVIVDLGNNFATTEAEITDFAKRISGAANIAGFATEDVFALGAAFSSVGVEAGLGGTAVQKVMIGINTAVAEGNEDLQKFAEVAGMSAEQFQTHWREDAGGAFAEFVNGLGRQGDQAAGVLEELGLADQRLMRAFLSLANAGDLVNRTLDTGRKAMRENTALSEEAAKRYKTIASRLEMLKNRFIALGISIGDALMPTIEKAIDFTTRLTEAFEDMSADMKAKTLMMAGLFAAAGPLMFALAKFARVVKGLASLVKSKFAIIVAAFTAGVGIGQWYTDNWDKFTAKFEMNMIAIEQAATHAVIGIIKAFKSFFNFATTLAPPELITNLFGIDLSEMAMDVVGVNSLLDKLKKNVQSNGKEMKDAVIRFYSKPWTSFFESAKNGMSRVGATFMDFVGNIVSGTSMKEFLESLSKSFEKTGGGAAKLNDQLSRLLDFIRFINEDFEGFGQNKVDAAIEAIKAKLGEFINFVNFVFTDFSDNASGALQFAKSVAMDFTHSFGQGMANVIVQGERLIDTLKNIGKLLVSSVIQKGLGILLTGGLSGVTGFFGDKGGLFGAIFGRDIGGPAMAGQPYLIGQGQHQELFIPDRSGSVVPNSKMRGMGGGSGGRQVIENHLYINGRELEIELENQKYGRNR